MNATLRIMTLDEIRQLDERLTEEIDRPVAVWAMPDRIEARREIAAELERRAEVKAESIAHARATQAAVEADSELED